MIKRGNFKIMIIPDFRKSLDEGASLARNTVKKAENILKDISRQAEGGRKNVQKKVYESLNPDQQQQLEKGIKTFSDLTFQSINTLKKITSEELSNLQQKTGLLKSSHSPTEVKKEPDDVFSPQDTNPKPSSSRRGSRSNSKTTNPAKSTDTPKSNPSDSLDE